MLPDKRRTIAAAAVACFVAAFALTPSEVRSRFTRPVPAPSAAPGRPADPPADVVPAGDPFVPHDPGDDPDGPATIPALPGPGHIGPLPPNAGAAGTPLAGPSSAPRLRALVLGTHPLAAFDDGGTMRLVEVGDAIAGSAVAAIDAGGVTLTDARRLTLPSLPGGQP